MRRRREGGSHHADQDRPDGEVLVASGVLSEQTLGEQHQHQKPGRERRLDDHERGQHQRHDLKRPAEHREPRAREPARAPGQAPGEGQPQVLLVGRLLGVERLQGDP
jgi:hypothetical protein